VVIAGDGTLRLVSLGQLTSLTRGPGADFGQNE
jgi:hypothetical protein